jgi:hypothetical protein
MDRARCLTGRSWSMGGGIGCAGVLLQVAVTTAPLPAEELRMVRQESALFGRGGRSVILLAALAAAGCSKSLDMAALNQSISSGINQQLSLPIASVTCPAEERPLQVGDTFDCVATPQAGGKLTVTVTQKDGDGNVAWEVTKTEGLLDLDKVEAAVVAGLKAQAGVEATVDCGERWKAATPGETFQCQAAVADGRKATVKVTTKDVEGNIDWSVE